MKVSYEIGGPNFFKKKNLKLTFTGQAKHLFCVYLEAKLY